MSLTFNNAPSDKREHQPSDVPYDPLPSILMTIDQCEDHASVKDQAQRIKNEEEAICDAVRPNRTTMKELDFSLLSMVPLTNDNNFLTPSSSSSSSPSSSPLSLSSPKLSINTKNSEASTSKKSKVTKKPRSSNRTADNSENEGRSKLYRAVKSLRISQLRHMSCILQTFANDMENAEGELVAKHYRRQSQHIRHLSLLYLGQMNQVRAKYS